MFSSNLEVHNLQFDMDLIWHRDFRVLGCIRMDLGGVPETNWTTQMARTDNKHA